MKPGHQQALEQQLPKSPLFAGNLFSFLLLLRDGFPDRPVMVVTCKECASQSQSG